MTISKLLIVITILAAIFTAMVVFGLKKHKKVWITFLQSFCGILFIISGWVKVMDPMGTGFKMQQYFAEFDAALEPTWMSFVNGIWPILDNHIFTFSMIMIILEIVLGVALLLGSKPKLTSWIFFLLFVFFTILTGFTFLTGYVPTDTTFFDFKSWGPFVKTNMRVTDCGCFGDFIKLDPRTSFFKDVFLMIPAVIFLITNKHFHQILNKNWRNVVLVISTLGLIIYGMSNYVWNLPGTDFRPFKQGVNILEQKEIELDAQARVQVVSYKLKSLEDNLIVEIPYEQYLANYSEMYSDKTKWETIEQVLSEPDIEPTKISEFSIYSDDGYDIAEDLLSKEGYQFMIISYKLKADESFTEVMVPDTIFRMDTVIVEGTNDTNLVKTMDRIEQKSQTKSVFDWNESFLKKYQTKIKSLTDAAMVDNITSFGTGGAAGFEIRKDLEKNAQLNFVIYEADDILLKTIIRSNPGVLLLKEGTIVNKWHFNQLPSYEEIKNKWIK